MSAPDGMLWLIQTAQRTRGCTRREWQARVASDRAEGPYGMQWTSKIRRPLSHDDGYTWGPTTTAFGKAGAFCRQPAVVLANGDWLLPIYYSVRHHTHHGGDHTVMQITSDEGRTWAVPERTALPNNNSSIQATRLASGAIALAFNACSAGDDPDPTLWPRVRYPLTVALSEDEGCTWSYRRHVDAGDDFCGQANEHLNRRCGYPSILQTADGPIHVAYSFRGRQCIKYVRADEQRIRAGLDTVYDEPRQ